MNLESEVLQVNIDDIIPNRFQPRLSFDEQGLKELADSIKEHGIIQPLVLRKLGDKYEIIAGERRYKAATMAGLVSVPAVISNIDDNKSAEVALVENVQRRDLTPIEEARSYKSLLDKGYLTQEQLAKKMGLSQSAIANKLRLLNLDEEVQQALMNEKISERHARALLTINDKEKQKFWLNRIINERLTVRQLDMELKKDQAENADGDVPLAKAMPNIDQIKSQAVDIIPNREKRSVESMMVPEDMMTEFSGALPVDVAAQNPTTPNPSLEDVNNQILPQPENKFFNFSPEESANMDTGISMEPTNDNMFQVAAPDPIIEPAPQIADFNNNPMSNSPATPFETLDFGNNPSPVDSVPLNSTPIQPVQNPITMDQPINIPASNPANQSIQLEPVSIPNSLDINLAVNTIHNSIDNLKSQGYNINVQDQDLGTIYQINININK